MMALYRSSPIGSRCFTPGAVLASTAGSFNMSHTRCRGAGSVYVPSTLMNASSSDPSRRQLRDDLPVVVQRLRIDQRVAIDHRPAVDDVGHCTLDLFEIQ